MLILLAPFLWPENGPEIRAHFSAGLYRPRIFCFVVSVKNGAGWLSALCYNTHTMESLTRAIQPQFKTLPRLGRVFKNLSAGHALSMCALHYACMLDIVQCYRRLAIVVMASFVVVVTPLLKAGDTLA